MTNDTKKDSTEQVSNADRYVRVTQNVIDNSLLFLAVVMISMVASSLFYFSGI
jgi:hypothetical protein